MKKEDIKPDDSVKSAMKIEAGNEIKTSAAMKGPLNDTGEDGKRDADISLEELALLDKAGADDKDDQQLENATLDNKDNDGELLNVSSSADDKTGRDLDIPGTEDDDEMEDIGEEDEENNPYSLSDNSD